MVLYFIRRLQHYYKVISVIADKYCEVIESFTTF